MYNPLDTIAAIATPPGEGALAIVRLSGPSAKAITDSIFAGAQLEDRKAVYGHIKETSGSFIDEAILIFYQKPHGYTAEDMVEMICHGGHVIAQQILTLLCRNGARLAEPGEFTLRAFLNGRIDLTEAEAVNTVIRSRTEKAKHLALNNLEGKLHYKIENAHAKLMEIITTIEAQIDFADDEINKLSKAEIATKLNEIQQVLQGLLSTYNIGRLAEGRVQIAIVGAPNVGKSTLFNALLSEDRAIVTDIPGTTRDYLSEYINIGGYPVILTDTAGIRPSNDIIETEGIERTKQLIEKSDLCLFVLDATRPVNDEDLTMAKKLANHQYILVLNKIDKAHVATSHYSSLMGKQPMGISAVTGKGIDKLNAIIVTAIIRSEQESDDGILLSQRQYDCATKAYSIIDESIKAHEDKEPDEVVAGLLRECLDTLGELVGKITSEDILNRIFGQFCIGK